MASHRRLVAEAGRLLLGDACNNDVLAQKHRGLDKIAHRPQRAILKEFRGAMRVSWDKAEQL